MGRIYFINDLCINNSCMTHLIKYADDTTIQVNVSKFQPDESRDTVNQYFEWSDDNCMPCNLKKCKELCLQKKCKTNCSNAQIDHITQVDSLKILGVTFQSNCRFTEHVRSKLVEANRCLFVIRSLRKEGYNQADIDHLFASIVLPKITYGLSVYAASSPELTTVQNFLRRCYKRKYISYAIDVNELIDKSDRRIFNKIKKNCNHPLYEIMPKIKQTSLRLRNPTSLLPRIHTERFKASYINRLYFKYKLFL